MEKKYEPMQNYVLCIHGKRILKVVGKENGIVCEKDCAMFNYCDPNNFAICSKRMMHFKQIGTTLTTDEILDIVTSIMVIPPAQLDMMRQKLNDSMVGNPRQ